MSEPVQIALIVAISQVIPVVLSILLHRNVKGLHHEMNSMKDALIKSARVEGHAQGVKDEKAKPT